MKEILKLTNLSIIFGGLVAIDDLNLSVSENEIVALIGPNGAGKTTCFNLITGIYKPTTGTIALNRQSIVGKRPDEITRLGIARTFQNIRLFSDLTVFENVLIADHLRVNDNVFSAITRLNFKQEKFMRERAEELLEEQGLIDLKDEKAKNLPYGYQRRLEIARALATKPSLLLLDEPAAGMNPQETLELTKQIDEIRHKYNLSILVIEHHMDLIMNISDRIYVLNFGKLLKTGTPTEIQNDKDVIGAYLGE